MQELQTGDVVVSAGVGVGGAFMRITDVSIFSHSSIVVRDPYVDQPCLWESIGNDEGLYQHETDEQYCSLSCSIAHQFHVVSTDAAMSLYRIKVCIIVRMSHRGMHALCSDPYSPFGHINTQ